MIKILTGSLCYRGKIAIEQAFMWMDLGAAIEACKEGFDISGFQYTDFCGYDYMENNLLQSAIESNVQWLFMIAPDYFMFPTKTSQPGSDILNMIRLGEEKQAAVVAANLNPFKKNSDATFTAIDDCRGKVESVDRVELGISVINTQWIVNEAGSPPWFKNDITQNDNGFDFVKSDTIFCDTVRSKGGLILCDGRVGFGQKVQGERQ